MTELVVSDGVAQVPGVLAGVGDSLSVGEPTQTGGGHSASLAAALWVSNQVLPEVRRTNVEHIRAASVATGNYLRAVIAVDESGPSNG